MNKSEFIRSLAKQGLSVAEIARRVGIRYQFARNVLKRAGLLPATRNSTEAASRPRKKELSDAATRKPVLTCDELLRSGFLLSSRWQLTADDRLALEQPLPVNPGVYAMTKNGEVLYVGLATLGIAKRFKSYVRPGKTQRTSIRLNGLLKKELRAKTAIEIYTVCPPNMTWNGLPVSGMVGLEFGLIEGFRVPWNLRGVSQALRALSREGVL